MKPARTFPMFSVGVGVLLASIGTGPAANFTVQMTDYPSFAPSSLSIAKGDSVTWVNYSYYDTHTSTSGDSPPASDGLWGSGDVGYYGSFTLDSTGMKPGTYPYFCGNHYYYGMTGTLTITNPPNVPPSVSLTSPVAGARFRAPANITLMAAASDPDGGVTNVQFFSGASPLGSIAGAPFNYTVSNVAAGNYSFTAVAADNQGATTSSAPVNVFVLTNAILMAPALLTNGQFQFTILGIAGQTYAMEASTNLTSWSAISTNVAPSNTFNVTDPSSANLRHRSYRVRQDL